MTLYKIQWHLVPCPIRSVVKHPYSLIYFQSTPKTRYLEMDQYQSAAFGDAFDPVDFGLEIGAPIIVNETSNNDKLRLSAAAEQIVPLFEQNGVEFTTDPFLKAAQAKYNPDYTKWRIGVDPSTYNPSHLEGKLTDLSAGQPLSGPEFQTTPRDEPP